MKERLQAWGDTKVIAIASCFVFDNNGQLLLLQRHTEDLGGGQWGTPGGRIEDGETAHAAALRELREETSIIINEAKQLGKHLIHMPHGTVHMTSFEVRVSNIIEVLLDPEEHNAFAWYDIQSILTAKNILWGIPTILKDFGYLGTFNTDTTLADGTTVVLL